MLEKLDTCPSPTSHHFCLKQIVLAYAEDEQNIMIPDLCVNHDIAEIKRRVISPENDQKVEE